MEGRNERRKGRITNPKKPDEVSVTSRRYTVPCCWPQVHLNAQTVCAPMSQPLPPREEQQKEMKQLQLRRARSSGRLLSHELTGGGMG